MNAETRGRQTVARETADWVKYPWYSRGGDQEGTKGRLDDEKATCLACEDIVKRSRKNIDIVLLDGNIKPKLDFYYRNIIKGDSNYVSIAAASIIAKQIRDKYMRLLDSKYKQYGWKKNVGYGTKEHLKAIKKYGITKYHRKSYKPIREILI